jgi:hypothetical protein
MSDKKLDAVEMKRSGAERIYQRTRKMSPAEELAYWRRRSEDFRQEQTRLARRTRPRRKAG